MTSVSFSAQVSGAGLSLHRSLLDRVSQLEPDALALPSCSNNFFSSAINFFEVAPENWIPIGGRLGKQFRQCTEKFPFGCHGLSLSLGSPAPLNVDLLKSIKVFLQEHNIRYYSEHLSYSGDSGNLYELLPIPFTEEAVHYVAGRIRQAQDILGQRIAIENTTYYYAPAQEMTEYDFINAVLHEADCALLLDVNNLFVNSQNHTYDPVHFLKKLPGNRISYLHIAGHDANTENFLIDTHGEAIVKNVWDLLAETYSLFGVKPTLLERDNNIPAWNLLMDELNIIKKYQTEKKS